uniref:SFRICE_035373 n=1 Tax=Spodoptera frugiperda TaxID=7108 RepID=A0A2H1WZK3_SPOFR
MVAVAAAVVIVVLSEFSRNFLNKRGIKSSLHEGLTSTGCTGSDMGSLFLEGTPAMFEHTEEILPRWSSSRKFDCRSRGLGNTTARCKSVHLNPVLLVPGRPFLRVT